MIDSSFKSICELKISSLTLKTYYFLSAIQFWESQSMAISRNKHSIGTLEQKGNLTSRRWEPQIDANI